MGGKRPSELATPAAILRSRPVGVSSQRSAASAAAGPGLPRAVSSTTIDEEGRTAMTSGVGSARVRQEPMSEAIKRLARFVQRFERRYELSSEAMFGELTSGRRKETAEISRWLSSYRVLNNLRGQPPGRTTGTPTKII